MGLPTPDDNLRAYEQSDVTRMVENFRGKEFFLIHGTADDNVHYQQSMMLARALEKADILFSSQVGAMRFSFYLIIIICIHKKRHFTNHE